MITVILLGLVSFLTDIGSEMIYPLVPLPHIRVGRYSGHPGGY